MHSMVLVSFPQYLSHDSLDVHPPGNFPPLFRYGSILPTASASSFGINPAFCANSMHTTALAELSQYFKQLSLVLQLPGVSVMPDRAILRMASVSSLVMRPTFSPKSAHSA